MKLLTFMQLAETKSEISFGEIQQHMQLGENEVEEFLIDRKFEILSVLYWRCFHSTWNDE
jgi:phage antirepressor YoqD-like protein